MYQRILVPVDGSATSDRGLQEAIRLARLTGGQLRLLHVVDDLSFALGMDAYAGYSGDWLNLLRDGGRKVLDDAKALATAAGIGADTVLYDSVEGRVHELTVAEAQTWPAEVIVIGTHGRRGVGRLVLGSSAEYVLRLSPVPVLLVRAPEAPAQVSVEAAAEKPLRVHLPSGALAIE
jgi:nucleotide-binding universal stress UspA family protein